MRQFMSEEFIPFASRGLIGGIDCELTEVVWGNMVAPGISGAFSCHQVMCHQSSNCPHTSALDTCWLGRGGVPAISATRVASPAAAFSDATDAGGGAS